MSESSGRGNDDRPSIYVFAGPNGGGKSSVIGRVVQATGVDYFNPDDEARALRDDAPNLTQEEADSVVWHEMRDRLVEAIEQGTTFAFETTLGGTTIPAVLLSAAQDRANIRIWYVALDSPERHIERVAQRVAEGGHSIPAETIRSRYDSSRANLASLIPHATEVLVFDNSDTKADAMAVAEPRLIMRTEHGSIAELCDQDQIPEWARAIVASARLDQD